MAKAKRKKAKSKTAKSRGMDAISLLEEDHANVKKAFRDFEKMHYKDPNAAYDYAAAVCNALKVHTAIEEEIFYPAVRAKIDDDDLMNEALVEHTSAKQLIRDIERMKAGDPMLAASFMVLGEYVAHHVKEEEGEIFPKARRLKLDLAKLGEEMLARKEALK